MKYIHPIHKTHYFDSETQEIYSFRRKVPNPIKGNKFENITVGPKSKRICLSKKKFIYEAIKQIDTPPGKFVYLDGNPKNKTIENIHFIPYKVELDTKSEEKNDILKNE